MIIHSVHAENVLKYSTLALDDLPEHGVVAISGANESGKSSIGETICFALFGRTFSLGPDQLDKVVRWGENHCSVTLSFSVDGQAYVLSRFLDKDGNHSAKLCLPDDENKPIARGVSAVADTMFELLGYEFEEFIESFYLAQREISTPHPHSLAVKIMAGVAPLEYVSQSFEDEIEQQNDMLDELNTEIDTLDSESAGLEYEPGRLAILESISDELRTEVNTNQAGARDLEVASLTYISNVEELHQVKGRLSRTRFFSFIAFVLAVSFGAVWGLLKQWPDRDETQMLLREIVQRFPDLQVSHWQILGMTAAGMGVLWLLLWIKASGIRTTQLRLQTESASLTPVMEEIRNIAEPIDIHSNASSEEDTLMRAAPAPVRPDDARYQLLRGDIAQTTASAMDVREYVEAESNWLRKIIERKETLLHEVKRDVEAERDKIRQSDRLQGVATSLKGRAQEIQERIDAHMLSIELLEGASEHMSNHFNRDVRDLVARTLPIFTQNRYEHLRIDEDLNVKVFSGDKREFMDLEEVSSGTQRQIMLALRLALSQKLLNRAVRGMQFAFLDEPFAFFDAERTKGALSALNALSDELSQIWIVSQAFPDSSDLTFAVNLDCARDIEQLSYP